MAAALGHGMVLQHGPARCLCPGYSAGRMVLSPRAWRLGLGVGMFSCGVAWGEAGAGAHRAESSPRGEGGGGREKGRGVGNWGW